ncbi:hypothetical protein C942_04938 [Photobacterium marinum]|uniref:Uncharacterized protein n=1 Tax=Photobacterium marinum TaxID=1056511 RepID=L8JBU6_9GAMM|nr:hypothetical protein C942_04938 [Photobacterium marinum]
MEEKGRLQKIKNEVLLHYEQLFYAWFSLEPRLHNLVVQNIWSYQSRQLTHRLLRRVTDVYYVDDSLNYENIPLKQHQRQVME